MLHRDHPESASSSRANVLVVEDDPDLRGAIAEQLSRAGYDIVTAGDGERALQVAAWPDHRIDLVLLGWDLPDLDGPSVLRRLRTASRGPVLVLSGQTGVEAKVVAFDAGADDYVTKPFAMPELMARVRAGLRRRAPLPPRLPASITLGSLRIELDRRRVTIAGRTLPLMPKDFRLLATLASEPGRIFSRSDLLNLVWGTGTALRERTVDVHVAWLRHELELAGIGDDPIRTIRGVGYCFAPPNEAAPVDVAVDAAVAVAATGGAAA